MLLGGPAKQTSYSGVGFGGAATNADIGLGAEQLGRYSTLFRQR